MSDLHYMESDTVRNYGINVRVTYDERQLFSQACALNDEIQSRVLRRAMKDYVQKARKKWPQIGRE